MSDRYLTTDEQLDVLVSIRETLHQIARTDADPHCWKWSIISLACATNGALVCNLSGTMQIGALKSSDRKKMISALQQGASGLPDTYLENPMKLLDMATNGLRVDPGSGPPLTITKEQRDAFERLIGFRNGFMHFQPMGWLIEIGGLPSICLDVMGILKCAIDDGYSFRHLEEDDRAELSSTFAAVESTLISMVKDHAAAK